MKKKYYYSFSPVDGYDIVDEVDVDAFADYELYQGTVELDETIVEDWREAKRSEQEAYATLAKSISTYGVDFSDDDWDGTFIDVCLRLSLSGKQAMKLMEQYAEEWHTGSGEMPFHTFLGLTWDEYAQCGAGPNGFDAVITARKVQR